MTDRYAFRYVETTVQSSWRNSFWAEGTNLLDDVSARFEGEKVIFKDISAPALYWGVLTPVCEEKPAFELVDSYGADAVRLAMLQPGGLSEQTLTGAWRLMNALWLGLRDKTEIAPEWKDKELVPALHALQKEDFSDLLIHLKSLFHRGPRASLLPLLYPFIPHLITHLIPDIQTRMSSFYQRWKTQQLPPVLFIEINGERIADFVPNSLENEEIKKEALSFPVVQHKINGRPVCDVKIIPLKGVNFVI